MPSHLLAQLVRGSYAVKAYAAHSYILAIIEYALVKNSVVARMQLT